MIFSSFDTRDLDKSDPKMDCGTHLITGGTGKYKGITGREPFACISVATPPGEPEGAFAIDIPHNTSWEIKQQPQANREPGLAEFGLLAGRAFNRRLDLNRGRRPFRAQTPGPVADRAILSRRRVSDPPGFDGPRRP